MRGCGAHLACWRRVCRSERSVVLCCAEPTAATAAETSAYKPGPCGCAGRRVHGGSRPALVSQTLPASQPAPLQAGACWVVGSHRWAPVHPGAPVATPAAKANTPTLFNKPLQQKTVRSLQITRSSNTTKCLLGLENCGLFPSIYEYI